MFKNERTFSWLDHHPCMAEGFAEFFKDRNCHDDELKRVETLFEIEM